MNIKSFFIILFASIPFAGFAQNKTAIEKEITATLKGQIMDEVAWALKQQPITVTAQNSPRSSGGLHDFYSEGDYWWPDSTNVNAPYVQHDGMTNPDNFIAHRLAMIRLSKIIGALASAYVLTKDAKYVEHAIVHLKAWFINPETLMNPNLQFAQAIKGRATGRGIGIIDTIQLMEVAQGVMVMQKSKVFDSATASGIKNWFSDYLTWLTTHQYGKDEMNALNNHGTCWVMQVTSFAKLTGNMELLTFCSERYKNVLLPDQMSTYGSFPLELKRTKPYGYSIFNLDAMVMICQILSTEKNNLWAYQTTDGKSIYRGIEFMYPFVTNKSAWTYPKDVMYWNDWPVAQPFLVFGAIEFQESNWLATWKKLDHDLKVEEVIRNLPIRHPLIWM